MLQCKLGSIKKEMKIPSDGFALCPYLCSKSFQTYKGNRDTFLPLALLSCFYGCLHTWSSKENPEELKLDSDFEKFRTKIILERLVRNSCLFSICYKRFLKMCRSSSEQMCLETHFQYEFSILGCFGQSGLQREKKITNCH